MEHAGELAIIFFALAVGGFLKGAVGAGAPVIVIPVSFALMSVVQIPTLWFYGIPDGTRVVYGLLAVLPFLRKDCTIKPWDQTPKSAVAKRIRKGGAWCIPAQSLRLFVHCVWMLGRTYAPAEQYQTPGETL